VYIVLNLNLVQLQLFILLKIDESEHQEEKYELKKFENVEYVIEWRCYQVVLQDREERP